MSHVYRIEREVMARGQTTPTFRVIERMGGGKHPWYKTVRAGLSRDDAQKMSDALNDQHKQARDNAARHLQAGRGYRR